MQIDSIVVKSRHYTMNSTWKGSIRNRWLLMTRPLKGPSDPRATWATSIGPAPLAALFGFVPTSSRPNGSGWTISGTVPARVATVALGLGIATTVAKVDMAALEGDVRMDVAVDASYLPTALRISGEDVVTTPALPKNVRTALEKSRGVTTFTRYGEPVTVVAPHESLTFTE